MPKFFREPDELPAGFFEAVQPLARWALSAMREAYRLGYSAGNADSSTDWKEILDRYQKKPPTGSAPAASLS